MSSSQSGERQLTLDRRARIIVSGDALHIVYRRGLFELRGKGVERLHERLTPILDGRCTREELLASVAPHTREVGRYLDGLAESGALCEGVPPPDLPAGFPAPRAGVQVLTIGSIRIAVTLSGDEANDAAGFRLSFASRATIAHRLLELEDFRTDAGRMWIACDDDSHPEELVRRGAVARHLLAIAIGRGLQRQISIFDQASGRLSLRQLALASPSTPFDKLAAQLQVVQMLDRPQLPLVMMSAELPGLGRRRVGCGFDAAEITAALLPACLGREALLRRIDLGLVGGTSADIGQRGAAKIWARLTRSQGARAVVASSRTDCVEEMIRAWALDAPSAAAGPTIDLLTVDPPSARVAVLQDALRRRQPSLPAQLDERLSPLVVIRSPRFAVARPGLEEALAEGLLRGAADAFGLDPSDVLASAPSLQPRTRRRRVVAMMRRLAGSGRFVTGRFRLWGTTLFFGVVDSPKEETP